MNDNINDENLISPPSLNGKNKRPLVIAVVSVLIVVILAIISATLVKVYVITNFTVNGISMFPTLDGGNGAFDDDVLDNGETLYLNKVAKIKRNSIVVFKPDWASTAGKAVVKRVIAVEGDRLKTENNQIYLNGKLLNEPYLNEPMLNCPEFEITVPDNAIVCMGDNRNFSNDCRFNAPYYVSLDTVIGRCFLVKGIDGKLRTL